MYVHLILNEQLKLTTKIIDSLKDTLSQYTKGLYMIRIPTSIKEADKVKDILSKELISQIQSGSLSIKSIHSKGKNGSIKRELRRATKLSMKKNVIIIVVGGLSAGFRFSENIKRNIRFVFENSRNKLRKGAKSTYAQWCIKYGFRYYDRIIPEDWLKEKGKDRHPKFIKYNGIKIK